MKKLLRYMREYRFTAILGPLFKLLEASFELFVPLIIVVIIDRGIPAQDSGHMIRMCLLLVVLGVIGLVCAITAQYFAAKASVGFAKHVKHALLDKIQSLSYSQLDTIGNSTLVTRLTSDVNQVQTGINLTLRLLLRSPFVVFGSMIMAFTIHVRTAVIFAAVIPLLSVVVFGIMLWSIPRYKQIQSQLDTVLRSTRETLKGARVIRAFCREDRETEAFQQQNEALTASQKFTGKVTALTNPLTYVIVNIGILVLIRSGAIQVNSGNLTQGEVVALYNYMSQILLELVKFANLILNITKSVACGNRIQAVLDLPEDMTSPESDPSPELSEYAVEFDHVSLRYSGAGASSLENISFCARPGDVIGVIGGTGSGKTSLVNLIPRFYDVESGTVRVFGIDVRDYPQETLRKQIGIAPQKSVLFRGTIRDNLLWGNPNASDSELLSAAETAQAADVLDAKGGLEGMLLQGGSNLSGGQKQRLNIARAIVRQPRILILDDSASALDFQTEAALRKSLRHLPDSPTVFIVSQRISSIRHADQILVLDDGYLVGCGCHNSLLNTCQVYREIWASQMKEDV